MGVRNGLCQVRTESRRIHLGYRKFVIGDNAAKIANRVSATEDFTA